jgi:hypothetical protein
MGPLAVVLVLFLLGFGGYGVDVPLADLTAGPVTVGGDVRIVPLSGWRVARRTAGKGRGVISLTRGGGNLRIVTGPFGGDPKELATAYLREFVEPHASHLDVSSTLEPVRLDSGLMGVRVAYLMSSTVSATPLEGQITAVVSPRGRGAVFDAWAPKALFPFETGDVDHMISTAEVN